MENIRIRDGIKSDPQSGIKKSRIRNTGVFRVMRHTSVALAVNSFLGILPPPPNLATGRWALGEEDPPVRATRRCRVIQTVLWIRIRIRIGSGFSGVPGSKAVSETTNR
jgi:hypothetical protein